MAHDGPRTRRGGRTATLAVLLPALVLASGASTPVAAASTSVSAAGSECVRSAAESTEAAEIAARCGQDVEVVSDRTEWSSVFVQPDGLMRLDSSTLATRTRKGDAWVPVDTALVATSDGISVAAPVTQMTFSDGSDDQPLVRMARDGHELTFDVPFALGTPVVADGRLTYDDVLPGVDLIVSVNADATGFSEVLRIESPEAAAHPALDTLRFPVETSSGLRMSEHRGGFVVQDPSGRPAFVSPPAAMWDSTPQPPALTIRALAERATELSLTPSSVAARSAAAVGGPPRGARVAELPVVVESHEAVSISPDTGMLTDPETVWPVYVDPSVTGAINQRAALRDAYSTKYGFTGAEGVGVCSRATTTDCPKTYRARLVWQFGGLEAIGAMASSDIESATFRAVGTWSYSCTPTDVTLYAVADFTSTVAYPGGDYWAALSTRNVAHKPECGSAHPVREIEFDATSHARAVADADAHLMAVGLRADESSMAYWKRYQYDAKLSIVYNRRPHAPEALRTTQPDTSCASGDARPFIREASPTFRAKISDPDATNVHAVFEVVDVASGARIGEPVTTGAQGSGSEHAVTWPVALQHDRTYRWSVRGDDGKRQGPTGSCELTVDLVAPVAPVVAPVESESTVYREEVSSGAIGRSGRFTFGPATSTDVVAYEYSFNADGLGRRVDAGSPTVSFTPTTDGPQVLRVRSVDRAGWGGAERVYIFDVASPSRDGVWKLDDGVGSVAGDASGNGNPIRLTGGQPDWVGGALADLAGDERDRGLFFDYDSDPSLPGAPDRLFVEAATDRAVVRTDESFSVMAVVRVQGSRYGAFAVSQDGVHSSGFRLGVRSSEWVFEMRERDDTSTYPWENTATAPVYADSNRWWDPAPWVHLTGIYDDERGVIRLTVCELGTPDEPGAMELVHGDEVPHQSTWNATGPLRLGRAKIPYEVSSYNLWYGAISDVRVYAGVVSDAEIFRRCHDAG